MKNEIILTLSFILVGCSQPKQAGTVEPRGADPNEHVSPSRVKDLNAFMVEKLIMYGARPKATNDLPRIEVKWHFENDKNGFQIRVEGNHFDQIDAFFQRIFGTPSTSGPGAFGIYKASDAGVAINYQATPTGVDIYCLKPKSKWE